jgi:hypothetical protein
MKQQRCKPDPDRGPEGGENVQGENRTDAGNEAHGEVSEKGERRISRGMSDPESGSDSRELPSVDEPIGAAHGGEERDGAYTEGEKRGFQGTRGCAKAERHGCR